MKSVETQRQAAYVSCQPAADSPTSCVCVCVLQPPLPMETHQEQVEVLLSPPQLLTAAVFMMTMSEILLMSLHVQAEGPD